MSKDALAELLGGLSEAETAQLAKAALVVRARTELLTFSQLVDPTYQTPPHIVLIANLLEAIERNDQEHAIITMPPRHGKSEIVSGKFPAWCLGRDPSRRLILSSYGAQLAETFSVQNRDTIAVNPIWPLIFPRVSVSSTVRSQNKWALHGQRESVIAAGVGGAVTGFGAWLFVIDDPIKNFTEAVSPSTRDKHWDWYRTVARTRLTPDGHIVLIMTRWHEDDLAGRIMNSPEAGRFFVLHLPAQSYGTEEDYGGVEEAARQEAVKVLPKTAFPDPLGRPKGEPLWPSLYNMDFLDEARATLAHEFEGLYQGNPTAPAGDTFKREHFRSITQAQLLDVAYRPVAKIRSWDLAWSEDKRADFTAGVRAVLYRADPGAGAKTQPDAMGLPPVALVVEHVARGRWEWPAGGDEVIKVANEDSAIYLLLIEAVASQSTAVKSIRRDPRMWKHKVLSVTSQKDKLERAMYAMRLAARGMIFFLYPTASAQPLWEEPFLRELADFPYGKNDDQVDALSQLCNHWQPIIDQALLVLSKEGAISQFLTPKKTQLPEPFRERSSTVTVDQLAWVPADRADIFH